MGQELNIIEASNIHKQEFKVVYKNGVKRETNILINSFGELIEVNNNSLVYIDKHLIDAKFIPIQKPVSFIEAVKSGKKVKDDEIIKKYTDALLGIFH